ncbi:hypothetical protein [Halomonas ramblicola]|uniref:hypothetical protein n=1 Tax=Halomonas ramblicola TaxID=747349 RepID=UPI0025B3761C|nr:hypothetical protein [Halomonas ramblicola]MDN3520744.1 hypothetical protein [Halomonas ramblicola]
MLKRLFRKQRPRCWIIKQVDPDLLHLCGQGTLESDLKADEALTRAREGRYRGGVRMGDTGLVLNGGLFELLVPEHELRLDAEYRAHWHGRWWEVATVPQQCWTWTGRLVTRPNPLNALPHRISVEDVSEVSRRLDPRAAPPGQVEFRPVNELEAHTRVQQRKPIDKLSQEARRHGERKADRRKH